MIGAGWKASWVQAGPGSWAVSSSAVSETSLLASLISSLEAGIGVLVITSGIKVGMIGAGWKASWVQVGPGSGAVSSSAATLLWVRIGVKGEFKAGETAISCGSTLEAGIWFEAVVGVES